MSSKNITVSSTKFNHAVASLDPSVARLVGSANMTPDAIDPYKTLKQSILARCRLSKDQRIRQVLQGDSLGDRKPTILLEDLRCLLDDVQCGNILESLFVDKISQHDHNSTHCFRQTGLTRINQRPWLTSSWIHVIWRLSTSYQNQKIPSRRRRLPTSFIHRSG